MQEQDPFIPLAGEGDMPQPQAPRCPYCQAQPCSITLGTTAWQMGPATAMAAVYCCAHCGCILSISALQVPPAPQRPPGPPPNRIIVPGTTQ